MKLEQARQSIAQWFARVYARGLTTAAGGNLSLRVGGHVVISPSGGDKGALQASDCAVVSLEAASRIDGLAPSCELPMHLAIYRARPDVAAIMHAHPVHVSAFAVCSATLRTDLFAEDYLLVPRLGVAAYHTPSSPALAEAAADAALGCQAVLLQGHGVLTLGDDLAQCFARLECLEHTAQVQWLCLGRRDVRWLSAEQKADIDQRLRRGEK
ncbi:MAG: class II aldolase/adducin family protein [Candidatus Cloacimonetes bacterium]|nr:class II aldolase/adducin family protein [Candidatus Cloacimonadota bacterium]